MVYRVLALVAAIALALSSAVADSDGWMSSGTARREIAKRIANAVTSPHDIDIELRYGVCVLEGTVSSERDRAVVEGIARAHPSVRELRNDLVVGPVAVRDSKGIASSIDGALSQDGHLKGYSIQVTAQGGIATLRGVVDHEADRDRIEHLAADTPGVLQVRSFLTVRPRLGDDALGAKLRTALGNEAALTSGAITAHVEEGVAVFRGTAEDHRTIDRLLSVALMVEGIQDVRSEVRTTR